MLCLVGNCKYICLKICVGEDSEYSLHLNMVVVVVLTAYAHCSILKCLHII